MTNICRCGTYNRVRAGIHAAAKEMAAAKATGAKPKKVAEIGKAVLNIQHVETAEGGAP
jgi:hypothetical protein